MTDKERARYEDAKLAHAALMKFYSLTLDDLDGELWRNLVGYKEHQISTFGKIKILKPFVDKDGYLQIALSKNGNVKKFKIHRLVAQAFISNPNEKPQINHIDGNKMNNHVGNLEWCTSTENNRHVVKIGLMSMDAV